MSRPSSEPAGADPASPAPPQVADHELIRCIGRGSYGQVWLARNALGAWRAVKVVRRQWFGEDERQFDREFNGIREYEPVSRVHASLLQVLHVGRHEEAGYFYYVMELADDANAPASAPLVPESYQPRTLRHELAQRGRLPPGECVSLGLALATALDQLHGRNLVHRDVKPSNIVFVAGQPKLADIGLVTGHDGTLSFVGTPGYLPPEAPGKPPGDIYALGKVLYEAATGLDRGEFPNLPPLGALSERERAGLNEINEVLLRACDPSLARRHASARELHGELALLESGGSIGRLRRIERAYARWRRVSGWVAAGLVLGALAFAVWFYRERGAMRLRDSLMREAERSRQTSRTVGWFARQWPLLEHAAGIQGGTDVLAQASAALAGLDARLVTNFAGGGGGSAAFAPDGRLAVGAARTHRASIIGTNETWIRLPLLEEGPVGWTDGVALQFIAASNRCLLVEMATGRVRREFPLAAVAGAGRRVVSALALTPAGARAAAATIEPVPRIGAWDAPTGKPLGEISAAATALAFSPDGTLLAAGASDGWIRLLTVPGLVELGRLPPARRANPILCLAIARDPITHPESANQPNHWLLAAGDNGGEIVLWDLASRVPRAYGRGSPWNVQALAFHPEGLLLASAGRNEQRIWSTMNGQLLLRLVGGDTSDARALAFNHDGTRLACATTGLGRPWPSITLWELEPHRGVRALRGLDSPVRQLWFSRDSELAAALADDWHLGIWETRSGRLRALLEAPGGELADNAGGAFDREGRWFAFAAGRAARLYDLASKQVIGRWNLTRGFADQLQFNEHNELLLLRREQAAGQSSALSWRVYRLTTGEEPRLISQQTDAGFLTIQTAFLPGGERFLVCNTAPALERRTIRAHDARTGARLWEAVTGRTNADVRVFLDPAGRWFGYTAGFTDRLRTLNVANFAEAAVSPDHTRAVGPSCEFAVGQHQYWQVHDRHGRAQGPPLGLDWDIGCAPAFSPDGTLLGWGTLDGLVLMAELEEVRRRLGPLR